MLCEKPYHNYDLQFLTDITHDKNTNDPIDKDISLSKECRDLKPSLGVIIVTF